MATERYQGWTNYPTWAVSLWIDNDQGLQEAVNEAAVEIYGRVNGEDARVELEIWLQGFIEEVLDGEGRPKTTDMASDLFQWAFEQINWREIAESHKPE